MRQPEGSKITAQMLHPLPTHRGTPQTSRNTTDPAKTTLSLPGTGMYFGYNMRIKSSKTQAVLFSTFKIHIII